jgi:hypothetical protein
MKSESGTYALILRNPSKPIVQIGLWRQIKLNPGFHIYSIHQMHLIWLYFLNWLVTKLNLGYAKLPTNNILNF